jgi:hypothetical protein
MAQAVVESIRREIRPQGSAVDMPNVRLRFATVSAIGPIAITFGDGVEITQNVFKSGDYTPVVNDYVAVLATDDNLYFVLGKSTT